jgi:hypothetical protein
MMYTNYLRDSLKAAGAEQVSTGKLCGASSTAPTKRRTTAVTGSCSCPGRWRDDARRRAEPPARPGGAPPGRDWPVALATGGCEPWPAPTTLGGAAGPEALRYLFASDHRGRHRPQPSREAPKGFANAVIEVDAS